MFFCKKVYLSFEVSLKSLQAWVIFNLIKFVRIDIQVNLSWIYLQNFFHISSKFFLCRQQKLSKNLGAGFFAPKIFLINAIIRNSICRILSAMQCTSGVIIREDSLKIFFRSFSACTVFLFRTLTVYFFNSILKL